MLAFDYYQKYQRSNAGSTVATRKPTPQDIRNGTGTVTVDFHVEQATERN